MKTKLSLLLLTTLWTAGASAAASQTQCHQLMTEKECVEHQAQLVTLPPGAALDLYLAEYTSRQKERETLCSCLRASTTGAARPQKQALLRF